MCALHSFWNQAARRRSLRRCVLAKSRRLAHVKHHSEDGSRNGSTACRLAGPRMGVEGVPRPGRGIGGDERVSGTMYRAVAAERETMAGLLPSCLRAFSALPDFLSSVQHFLNVPSVAVQRTVPGRACFAPQKPGRGRCRIRFRPRNLLRIYLVPFCVGYSQCAAWNQMLLSRVCFSIHLWTAFFSRSLVDGERQ